MLDAFRNRKTNVFAWILMGMLIVGLAGFGIVESGGLGPSYVARVGDQRVTSEAYARALDQELRAISSQIGRALPLEEARQFGIDRAVLARLANDAALDGEAVRLGLSTGDATVGAQVRATPAFQDVDGSFDRAAYDFALDRTGLNAAGFEDIVRREATRELLASSVQSPTDLPDSAALAVLGYVGERRGFDWLRLDSSLLPEPVPAPTDADLAAEHAAHPERYTRPETRKIVYASVTPDALAATIEIPEDELRAAYVAEQARFTTPERRILDRIGFRTEADAVAAKARLDAGETDFDALATERGFAPADIELGAVTADDLASEARAAVFGAGGPGIVGPVATPLGPSLYRINAVLAARTTPFEEAKAGLSRERALDEAHAGIAGETAVVEDLIAGGATLEEIASETLLELGTIDLTEATTGGMADDPAFRQLAADARPGEETDLATLADGRLVTLRVEAVEPPALIPLGEVRDEVAADWTAARTVETLTEQAEALAAELDGGLDFAALATRLGVEPRKAEPLTRGTPLPDVPRDLAPAIFAAAPRASVIQADGDGVILAKLTEIEAFDPAGTDTAALYDNLRAQFRDQAADDALALFVAAVRDGAGVAVNEELIAATLSRLP